jgi:hypothetical protein
MHVCKHMHENNTKKIVRTMNSYGTKIIMHGTNDKYYF